MDINMVDKTLGHYRVGEQLGRGGMGEVYVADDLNLNRKVALKFLPEAFAGDPERMARFEREARLLASLNHPNIAAIYGLEQAEGKRVLVLELVEGETLAQRISKGALPLDEALAICRQIADGLEAAHEKGVIHRDLKPANVMITEGDKVKILDFGLAKALSDETQTIDSSQSPTLTEAMTRPGVILGTAAYMSPEQAKGKSVDKRADIWAFGCILYECLTGKRAFEGDTVTETLASVLTKQPELEKAPAKTHALLRRCLEKDPKKRLRDIGEAAAWMESSPESLPLKRPWLPWCAAALFFVVALVLALPYFREIPFPEGAPIHFQIAFPDKVSPNTTGAFALSPDGRHLAFAGVGSDGVERLWLRTLESLEPRALPGTESNWISTIFWLPDSRSIVFPTGGKLKKVDISGGPPQILSDLNNIIVGGSSTPDGVILFAEYPASAIRRVSASGGGASVVVKPEPGERGTSYYHPILLPDGQHFLYLVSSRTPEKTGIYIGLLNSKPEEWPHKKILSTDFGIAYLPSQGSGTGQILFIREETLMAQRFDEKRLELIGQAVTVAEHVGSIYGAMGYFSASANGTIVFRSGYLQMSQPCWFDRKGKAIGTVDAMGASISGLALSPDGSRAAVSWLDSQAPMYLEIWLLDFPSGRKTRFTLGKSFSYEPVWSPDGSLIAFRWDRGASIGLYRKPASGAKQEELLLNSSENKVVTPTSWSRDGRFLLYSVENPNLNNDLWVLPLEGDRKPIPFVSTEFNEADGRFSPDMRWVAYESDETGITEIYVRAFSENFESSVESGGVIVSKGGGVAPRWRMDSKELYYRATDGKVMVVAIAGGTQFEAGMPTPLFNAPLAGRYIDTRWDAAPDGQRFLLLIPSIESKPSPFTVMHNWTSLLKK